MKNVEKYLNKFYDFIDKIGKHNFILIIFIFIVLIVTGLYQTFSLYTESEGLSILNEKDTYSFILDASNQTNSVTMAPGTSKNIDITIRNDTDVPLKYRLYSSEQSNPNTNFILGHSTSTKYLPNGIIPAKTNYIVTLKAYNYTDENKTVNFGVQYGFENNEELTLNSGQYLIEPLYIMKKLFNTDTDTTYFAAYRSKISEVSFVDSDAYAKESNTNVIATWNVSINNDDDSIKAWITENNDASKYKLYIGAKDKIYVEDLESFFAGMTSLTNVNFDNLDTSITKKMERLFKECTALQSTGITSINSLDTSNVTSMIGMFYKCSSLTTLDLSNFDTSNVLNMRNMFSSCQALTEVTFGNNFDISKVTNMSEMFSYCTSLISVDLGNLKSSNTSSMFDNCSSLTDVELSDFDTSSVTNMRYMFYNCSNLTTLDLSNFNTSKVTNMEYMFAGNASSTESENVYMKLKTIKLSSFDTSNVTNMWQMFANCSSLTTLDLSNFNTKSVTKLRTMFYGCTSLTSLNLSNLDTRNVTDIAGMFNGCSSLTTLTIGTNFDTSKVTDFNSMFRNCAKLTGLRITIKNNSGNNPSYSGMFTGAATATNAQILVYFADNTQTLVNNMVATKSNTSNVFVAPRLADMEVGDYVKYVGNNGCNDTTTVNGLTSCSGKNANASTSSMGHCVAAEHPFDVNGWRIGYINNDSVHLISAGATDCMCTNANGSTSGSSCSSQLPGYDSGVVPNINNHFSNMNNLALKYCNVNYAKGGVCNPTTAWAMNAVDFQRITGNSNPLSDTVCYMSSADENCGYNNSLIDNGGYYWFATATTDATHGAFQWTPGSRYVGRFNSSAANGVRPVLALDPSVYVTGGEGTYEKPYTISK